MGMRRKLGRKMRRGMGREMGNSMVYMRWSLNIAFFFFSL
jgi:hypothetical protein